MPRASYEVDAFVKQGKVEQFANIRRHFAKCSDVFKLRLIFWGGLKIKLCEAFKCSALLSLRWELLRLLPELAPRCAGGGEAILPMHWSPLSVNAGLVVGEK